MYKRIIKYFLNGLLFIVPLLITIYSVYIFFTSVDNFIQNITFKFIEIRIPGLGIIIALSLITVIGFIAQSYIFRPIRKLIDAILENTPIIKIIYTSLKDLLSAFTISTKFDKPVLVLMNKEAQIYKMGFITNDDLKSIGMKDFVSVYYSHSFTFSGETFIVPKENILFIDISSTEAMKHILSGGMTKI